MVDCRWRGWDGCVWEELVVFVVVRGWCDDDDVVVVGSNCVLDVVLVCVGNWRAER